MAKKVIGTVKLQCHAVIALPLYIVWLAKSGTIMAIAGTILGIVLECVVSHHSLVARINRLARNRI